MTAVRFTVYGIPQPAGSKKGFVNPKSGRVIITDDAKNSRPWKNAVADKAVESVNGSGLLEGPLWLGVDLYFPRPKGHYGARGLKPSAPPFPAVRPDVTKLLRAIEDALKGIVWRDDAQVVSQVAVKQYGEPARAEVHIRTLDTIDREAGFSV